MKVEINIDDKFFEEKLKGNRSASFSNSLDLLKIGASYINKKKLGRYPTYLLDSKILTYEFSKILNIKTVKILQLDVTIDEVTFKKNTVIKPMYENSAKGIFIYDEKLYYLNKNLSFPSENEAKKYAKELIEQNIVRKNKWMVEELIKNGDAIARDVKFYVFYGEVGLILESDRLPSLKRCWYDENFKVVDTGKYSNKIFNGKGENLQQLAELAKKISLEIPVPFVRIDFLQVNNDIYLGEFTPIPGGYASFNEEWDKKLGEYYQYATIRISNDIANGKTFNNYVKLNKNEIEAIQKIKEEINK